MSTVLITLFSCVLLFQTISAGIAEHPYLDECVRTTGIKVTPDMFEKIYNANSEGTFTMNTIPEEMLCLPKCVLEKRNIIDNEGKISMDNLKADTLMDRIPNQEAFLKCVEKIDKIATCDDMKKLIQCRLESQ